MIYLTKLAIEKIKEFADGEGLPYIVRIKIIGGGCAGFTQDMLFDNKILDTDEQFDIEDVKLVIDQLSAQYLEDTTIDYIESQFGGGFKFINPNVKSTCGCGNSYSF
jgi:iron-sulfur cluster insertion protein